MTIHLVEAGGRLLSGMSEAASKKALEYLEKMSVKVYLNCAVKSYDGHEISLSTGGTLISSTMIWAAGVTGKPVDGISPESLGRSGRIKVDEFNRVIGYENIFAIGDAAIMSGDKAYPNGHPQMAPPAMQQGRLVAENIKRLIKKRPLKHFRYHDKGTMATIGRNKAVVDLGNFRIQGFSAWLIWMFVHLVYLIGFRNKVFVLISWIWSYLSYDKSNRLIIARPKDGVN
jgi:NADH dehydrogenase